MIQEVLNGRAVSFTIRNKIADVFPELPLGVNERLTLCVHLRGNQLATVISPCAPTLDSDEKVKERFCSDLNNALASIPRDDKVIFLGDFNTQTDDHEIWSGTIDKNGMGKANANTILLLTKCAQTSLIMRNTIFCQKKRLKITWRHPRLEHWHPLDYIIV
ncbi:hypothetical protein Y1Q_0023161 [Alligator mississippiensis]|uniref:Endonuclease/exonuclease/phosphatase domain-containing protein n=1 Tax=Alligator mississippiensis TaxID=8496 RepID=A0A151MZ72_ALLMI|nr:hypothetical protein Y1Q_0023161 [Alligator mississippiensis]